MITVRLASQDDADAIARIAASVQALHVEALPGVFQPASLASFPASEVAALMASPSRYFWVGVEGDRTLGYLYAELQAMPATAIKLATARLYIHQMAVTELDRGRGVGGALLTAARDLARQHGLTRIALDVWRFNDRARAFYEREGFTVMREELWQTVDPTDLDRDQGV